LKPPIQLLDGSNEQRGRAEPHRVTRARYSRWLEMTIQSTRGGLDASALVFHDDAMTLEFSATRTKEYPR